MLCRYVMDFRFLVIEKSWKVIVEKQWDPGPRKIMMDGQF